jgi:hypothetical protein
MQLMDSLGVPMTSTMAYRQAIAVLLAELIPP